MNVLKPIVLDGQDAIEIATLFNIPGGDHFVLPEYAENFLDMIHFPHLVSETTLGGLEATSHQANGTAFFGAGNSTLHFISLFDHTSGDEFGLQDHYRTGDYVAPTKDANGNFITTMDAGIQNGLHNEQGTNVNRSAASADLSMNFGNEKPDDGKFVLDINGHDFKLEHSGTGDATQWFFADNHGVPVQGLTLSPDGHVLQDSANLAFFSNILAHGTNPADLSAQDVHISLTEMVGTVGVAQVSETIHLVAHPVAIT